MFKKLLSLLIAHFYLLCLMVEVPENFVSWTAVPPSFNFETQLTH